MFKSGLFHERKGLSAATAHENARSFGAIARQSKRQKRREDTLEKFVSKVQETYPNFYAEDATDEQKVVVRNLAKTYANNKIVFKVELLEKVGLQKTDLDDAKLRKRVKDIDAVPCIDTFKHETEVMKSLEGLFSFWQGRSIEEAKSASVNEDIADLMLLVMLKNWVVDPAILATYLKAMIFNSISLGRGHVVAYLKENLQPATRTDIADPQFKAARKIFIDREMLYLVKRLSKAPQSKFDRIFENRRFERALRQRLRAAGIAGYESTDSGLAAFGGQIEVLKTVYLPPFLRNYHTENICSCPQIPFWERFFSSKAIPVGIKAKKVSKNDLEVIDSILQIQGERSISDKEFLKTLNKHITYVKKNGPKGRKKRRACLQERLEVHVESDFSKLALTHAQKLVFLFAWRLAAIGIPSSRRKKKGTLKTIQDYIKLAADVVFEAYLGGNDWEVCEEDWDKAIELMYRRGNYNKRRAGRLALFFNYLDQMEMITPIPHSVIYKNVSDEFSMPLNQLISNPDFESALDLTDEMTDEVLRTRVILALTLGYYFGARFDEVWTAKYCHLVISRSHISFHIGGRGHDRAKSRAGNRRVIALAKLSDKARSAVDEFRELRDQQNPSRFEYIFHAKAKPHRDLGRAKFSRALNGLLKSSTGNPRARFHDLRKTYVNALVLNVFMGKFKSHYLDSVFSHYLLEVAIPDSVKSGGSRFKFWGQAVISQVGHSSFGGVTALWYFCYASELYTCYVSQAGLDQELRKCCSYLTRGECSGTADIYELCRSRGGSGIPEFPEMTVTYEATAWKLSDDRVIPISFTTVIQILQEGKPDDFSWMESVSRENREIRHVVLCEAFRIADIVDFLPQSISPSEVDMDLSRKSFISGNLPERAITEFQNATIFDNELLFGVDGIWEKSYRNIEGEEAYIFESEADIQIFTDFLMAVGFKADHIQVRSPAGSAMHALAEQSGLVHRELSLLGLRRYGPRNARKSAVVTLVNGRAAGTPVQYISLLSKLAFFQSITISAHEIVSGRA